MSSPSSLSLTGGIDGSLLLATAATFSFSLATVLIATPVLIRKMGQGGLVGRDVNKPSGYEVPELGGIAVLFAFSLSLSLIVGFQNVVGAIVHTPSVDV